MECQSCRPWPCSCELRLDIGYRAVFGSLRCDHIDRRLRRLPGTTLDREQRAFNRQPGGTSGKRYQSRRRAGNSLPANPSLRMGRCFQQPGFARHGSSATGLCAGADKIRRSRPSRYEGQVHAQDHCSTETLPGHLGLAPPDGYFPPLSPGVTTSVPPGPHAGNLDLSELSEGSTLYIPVWKPGALIYTVDSHAVQGDGEFRSPP